MRQTSGLVLKGRQLLPIVQGGMGVGISAHRLAGAVARLRAVGPISSGDLRRHHPDLMAATGKTRDRAAIRQANLTALDREIRAALHIAQGHGAIAVNVMRAVSQYADYVRQACESGAQAIVAGAGLPLDLPELTADWPDVALIPILSDSRGVAIVLKKWLRKNRLPDAIVIEHPRHAGGHLGAAKPEALEDPKFEFPRVLEEVFALFHELGIEPTRVPLIAAGGIASADEARALFDLGASAVQLGTAFAVTEEGDAHPEFKRILVQAQPQDIVVFMSVAGLPARAVRTPWLVRYLERLPQLQAHAARKKQCTLAWDCLEVCGLRDGKREMGQFCIDQRLAFALAGDVTRGLFFRGAGALPFGCDNGPVRELVDPLPGAPVPAPP